jgi:hypothetical protein
MRWWFEIGFPILQGIIAIGFAVYKIRGMAGKP